MIKLNDKVITPTIFPDGCSQIWKLEESLINSESYHIDWYFSNERELIHLLQLRALLHATGTNKKVTLYIDYLPYGRQDKFVRNDSCFGLYPFGLMLNMYRWDEVAILDPHSEIVFSVINKSFGLYPTQKVLDLYNDLSIDKVCYPDKGALVKYNMKYNLPFVHANKERDVSTGVITSHKLIGEVKDRKILIVDDLCDGGATFISLANMLYEANASEVNLFVTHGLFTKGLKHLFEAKIKNIYSNKGRHE